MTRTFPIWSQNLNQTIFDPFFGKITVEHWILVFDSFFTLFVKNDVRFKS